MTPADWHVIMAGLPGLLVAVGALLHSLQTRRQVKARPPAATPRADARPGRR